MLSREAVAPNWDQDLLALQDKKMEIVFLNGSQDLVQAYCLINFSPCVLLGAQTTE